jgi:hypothetical protein
MNKQILVALLILGGVALVAPSPRCGRGCKNLLQHIAEHELGNLLSALLA